MIPRRGGGMIEMHNIYPCGKVKVENLFHGQDTKCLHFLIFLKVEPE